jgi:hypothetical protein
MKVLWVGPRSELGPRERALAGLSSIKLLKTIKLNLSALNK